MPSGTLVGMPHDTSYRAVVVPLDGSELAERALTPGAWLAERFGAELHLLSADWHLPMANPQHFCGILP